MKNFIVVFAFLIALVCIADSKPAEARNEEFEDNELTDSEEEWLEELDDTLEALEDLREQYRLFGDAYGQAKGYASSYYNDAKNNKQVKGFLKEAKSFYNDVKKDKAVKGFLKEAKGMYKDVKKDAKDVYNVYKGVKSGVRLAG